MKKEEIYRLFEAFNKQKVMIIGDVMIDAYLWGKVDRISPEAPVPVVAVEKRANRLGGAANVALNIQALGAKPILCSLIGDDLMGEEFKKLLLKNKMTCDGILVSSKRPTTTKFRVIGNNTQLLRVDEEITNDLYSDEEKMLFAKIKDIISNQKIDSIIFQDYNKGVLSERIIKDTIKLANENNIPTIVDPKKKNFEIFKNVSLFKPNLKELKEGMNLEFNTNKVGDIQEAVKKLQEEMKAKIVLNTLSENGVLIRKKTEDNSFETHHIPAHIRNIADVSGAGDTVVSVASLCLAANISSRDLAAFANLAGGLVCEEVGVVPIKKDLLLEEIIRKELV
ncbi:MAG: bifunctional heptose 7-phosphate kinase/heptose 1-phosphate adenyltransferase [Bacteroidales bacterium]